MPPYSINIPASSLLITGQCANLFQNGGSPLSKAPQKGLVKIVQMLLDNGAGANDQNVPFHKSSLILATRNGRSGFLKLILDHGVDANTSGNSWYGNALHDAATRNNPEVVQMLLENGANPNLRGRVLGTPLLAAIEYSKRSE
jgi:ankyrin repeat protein